MHSRLWLLKVSILCMQHLCLNLRPQRYISNLRKRIPGSNRLDIIDDPFNNGRNRRRRSCRAFHNDVFRVYNQGSNYNFWFFNLFVLDSALLLHLKWQAPGERRSNNRLRPGDDYAPRCHDGQYDWCPCQSIPPLHHPTGLSHCPPFFSYDTGLVQSAIDI